LLQFHNWSTQKDSSTNVPAAAAAAAAEGTPTIELAVPPGQLEVGQLLLRCMYSAQPEQHISSASQSQLLQLLLLADRYQVPRVFSKVVAALQDISLQEIAWSTVAGIYALPAGCIEMAAFKPVFELAADKVQAELGDLELVWQTVNYSRSNITQAAGQQSNSSVAPQCDNLSLQKQYLQLQQERQQQLLGLPLLALKQLLQDPRTKVASKNTVWYTLDRWCKHQAAKAARRKAAAATASAKAARTGAAAGNGTPRQHTAEDVELASLVRMPHCSVSYLPMVISRSSLAAAAFTAEDLAVAALLQQQPQLHGELRAARHPVMVKLTAWQLGRQPQSAVKFLRLQWKLPVQKICQLFSEHTASAVNHAAGDEPELCVVGHSATNQSSSGIAASAAIPTLQREQTQAWCGHEFGLAVTLRQQGQQQLLSLVCVMRASWGQVHQVSGKITIAAVAQAADAAARQQQQQQQRQRRVRSIVQRFSGPAVAGRCTMPVGWASVQLRPGVGSAAELVRRLRQLGLVHADGACTWQRRLSRWSERLEKAAMQQVHVGVRCQRMYMYLKCVETPWLMMGMNFLVCIAALLDGPVAGVAGAGALIL
jgi:hypothetical protein